MIRITLSNAIRRQAAHRAIDDAAEGQVVEIKDMSRTLEQNALQWPILQDWANQKEWPVNGAMSKLSKEEWKDILTSAFEGETSPKIAAGFNGGIVMLGKRTSAYGKSKFSEWIEWLLAASHHAGIRLSAPDRME